jgi:hypothetical protein
LEAAGGSAGRVKLVAHSLSDDAALQGTIEPGCYLVVPPRVAMEARGFRERADEAEVPVFILTREPRMQTGMCPVVAVSPVTVRAYVEEPTEVDSSARKGRKKKTADEEPSGIDGPFGRFLAPSTAWMVKASEALGDAAIAQCATSDVAQRVELLYQRLLAVPEHEKLHQRLREACEEARRVKVPVPAAVKKLDDDEDE